MFLKQACRQQRRFVPAGEPQPRGVPLGLSSDRARAASVPQTPRHLWDRAFRLYSNRWLTMPFFFTAELCTAFLP